MKSLGIAMYCAALKVGVHCHSCLEIPVVRYIGVGPDEEYDLEAVGGQYSCGFDSLGEERTMRVVNMVVRRGPLLEGWGRGKEYKGESGTSRFAVIYTTFINGRRL